jgi:hypothetical protein
VCIYMFLRVFFQSSILLISKHFLKYLTVNCFNPLKFSRRPVVLKIFRKLSFYNLSLSCFRKYDRFFHVRCVTFVLKIDKLIWRVIVGCFSNGSYRLTTAKQRLRNVDNFSLKTIGSIANRYIMVKKHKQLFINLNSANNYN